MINKNHKIGVVKATSLVAGNMIGSGVLLAPAILAPYGNISIIGWILTTIGALALALVFSYLSRWITKAGGPYTFAKHVFGDFVGFQMAWGYWISTWCGSVSLLIGALQYMSIFFPELTCNPLFSITIGISVVIIFTIINMQGIQASMSYEVLIVIVKVVPLVIIALVGIFHIDSLNITNIDNINLKSLSSLGKIAPVLLWAFIGLESATVPATNVDNPKKIIPIATLTGVLLTAFIYICGAIVISGIIPSDELLNSQAPYVDAAKKIFGQYGATLMAITGIIGFYGSLNGWIFIQGQVPYSAAEEGLFPQFFLKKNKYGAPYGIIAGSILMIVVFLMTYQPTFVEHVTILIEVSVLAMLLPYFYSVIAFEYLAFCKKQQLSGFEKILIIIIGIIAFLYTFLAIFGSGEKMVCLITMIFLISVPFFCLIKKSDKNGKHNC